MPRPRLIKSPESSRPVLEATDSGLYLRLGPSQPVARTIVRRRWPFLAVDLDESGRAIGIEAIPRRPISIERLATDAGVVLC